jgi:hypothetical protein
MVAGLLRAASPAAKPADASWNPRTAAAYLDRRADWWMTWPGAARDHDTFCVSCHTLVAYSLARPTLRAALGETAPSPGERRCLDNVTKRVRLWKEVKPYYGGGDAARSRGTEAVLNALVLASHDALSGNLSADTSGAFTNMWGLQQTSGNGEGAWDWIQFDNEPWEAHDSQYYGAALAALAVGAAPGYYRSAPETRSGFERLRDYLNREFPRQSLINQAVVLWASVNWPGLLAPERQRALVNDLLGKQQADGGWSLSSLVWSWRDWSLTALAKLWVHSEATPLSPKSDGYATGLIALALRQSGLSPDDPRLSRARAWLVRNQNKAGGQWPAYSPNGKRDHSYGEGLFMNDAATAYAVLALTAR